MVVADDMTADELEQFDGLSRAARGIWDVDTKRLVDECLKGIASSGKYVHPWSLLSAALLERLSRQTFAGKVLNQLELAEIRELVASFNTEAPFTIQRIAEVTLWPERSCHDIRAFQRSLVRLFSVTSTVGACLNSTDRRRGSFQSCHSGSSVASDAGTASVGSSATPEMDWEDEERRNFDVEFSAPSPPSSASFSKVSSGVLDVSYSSKRSCNGQRAPIPREMRIDDAPRGPASILRASTPSKRITLASAPHATKSQTRTDLYDDQVQVPASLGQAAAAVLAALGAPVPRVQLPQRAGTKRARFSP